MITNKISDTEYVTTPIYAGDNDRHADVFMENHMFCDHEFEVQNETHDLSGYNNIKLTHEKCKKCYAFVFRTQGSKEELDKLYKDQEIERGFANPIKMLDRLKALPESDPENVAAARYRDECIQIQTAMIKFFPKRKQFMHWYGPFGGGMCYGEWDPPPKETESSSSEG
jgi:hypothetical protein